MIQRSGRAHGAEVRAALRALMSSWGHERLDSPAEVALAGRVSGVLWLSGAVTLLLTLALPGTSIEAQWAVALIAAFAVVWGTLMVSRVSWAHSPARLSHVSTILSLGIVAALTRVTGSTNASALDYLWLVVVYAAFFYTPRQAVAYWLACGVVHALPFLYDGQALDDNLARELVVVVPIYFLVGGVVMAGRELLAGATRRARELEARQRRMTEEQSSLRRVATAVAAGSPPAGIFALVSLDAGHLLGADCAAIVRFQSADRVIVLGRWTHDEHGAEDPDATVDVRPGSLLDRLRCGETIARDRMDGEYHCMRLAAPVRHGAAVWGALVVVASDPHEFAPGAEERLQDYADLIATAVANAEHRARLDAEAATDALTGLPNHRAFRERLAEEVARAQRHDRPLTVALLDVDGFRDLNDRAGLDVADEVLVEIGSLLRGALREEDVLARLGADEYGVIFVESDRHQALMRADRARRVIAETADAPPAAHHGVDRALRPRGRELRRRGAAARRLRACTGPSSTGATCAGSTTRRSCASSTSASARASSTAPRRSSGCARWRGPSTPRTPPPRSTQSASRRSAPAWRWRAAGRPTASRCCATPRSCTTSARSACPTRSCSRTGRSTTRSSRSCASTPCWARASSATCSRPSRSPGSPATTSAPTAAATRGRSRATTCPRAPRCWRSPTPGT